MDKPTHWDLAVTKLYDITNKRAYGDPDQFLRLRVVREQFGQVLIDVQYIHPTLGTKSDTLAIFSDGTWRYIAT